MAGYDCMFERNSQVDESVILSGCTIGEGSRLRRVLMDKNCRIAPGVTIGYDEEADRARFPFVSPGGIVVLPKGTVVPRTGPVELAWDLVPLLDNDPATAEIVASSRDKTWRVGARSRHSHDSTVQS